ncbi:MAG: NitT/TauT family transport system permease protein [Chloroflexota bacterium]|jgi:NitT/TauT family transport system permease protein|nr:NitT/TauT family transport system permease protein [Chloroflexota bacterium]
MKSGLTRSARPKTDPIRAALSWIGSSRTATQVAVLVGLAVAWEIGGRLLDFRLIPPFSEVARAFFNLIGTARFQTDAVLTTLTFMLGFIPALLIGIPAGVLMGRFSKLETILDPYVNAAVSMPMAALVPLLLLVLGTSIVTRAVIVFLFSVFMILIGTLNGIKNTDRSLIEMARSFGARESTILSAIAIPSALPLILGGVRVGIGRAVAGAIIAELLTGALSGLGGRIQSFGSTLQMPQVYAIVLGVTLVAWIATEVIFRAEARLGHWRHA